MVNRLYMYATSFFLPPCFSILTCDFHASPFNPIFLYGGGEKCSKAGLTTLLLFDILFMFCPFTVLKHIYNVPWLFFVSYAMISTVE